MKHPLEQIYDDHQVRYAADDYYRQYIDAYQELANCRHALAEERKLRLKFENALEIIDGVIDSIMEKP